MSEFVQKFLNEDWESLKEAPRIYVGAFGKHPGWNDHLDDIGLLTESLASTRRIVYGTGIATQIESAAWDEAGAQKTLAAFDHLMLWNRPGESIVGCLKASRDGKGRALYPLVVVTHCVGQGFDWIAGEVIPNLERAIAECAAAPASNGVFDALNRLQNHLRERGQPQAKRVAAVDSPVGVPQWSQFFVRERTPLLRVFHHLEAHLSIFGPGSDEWFTGRSPALSRTLRLPVVPEAAPAESLNAWLSFLGTQLDPAVPLLGLLPRGQTWIDVIVGEPAPADFFLLKANATAVPPISEIPYQVDPALRERLHSVFDELAQGRLPGFSALNLELLENNRAAADKWLAKFRPGSRKGLFSRLLVGGTTSTGTRFGIPPRLQG